MRLMPGQRRPGALAATVTVALLLTVPGLAAAPASASAAGSPAVSGSAPAQDQRQGAHQGPAR